eukprot:15457895-Alexandrium_andersonii.AAC.1
MAAGLARAHIVLPCDASGDCAIDAMARLEHRALGQATCRDLRAFLAEGICQHVTDPAWRA